MNDFWKIILSTFAGGLGGYAAAVLAFKLDLALLKAAVRKMEDDSTRKFGLLDARIDGFFARFNQIDRRQIVQLEILADVARKVGADGRVTDLMVNFMREDGK